MSPKRKWLTLEEKINVLEDFGKTKSSHRQLAERCLEEKPIFFHYETCLPPSNDHLQTAATLLSPVQCPLLRGMWETESFQTIFGSHFD
uniref:Uncharacterized protein n=1 Tax=Rhodnius prolixus TaxID=13249 RepID=T1I2B7_RHOPR